MVSQYQRTIPRFLPQTKAMPKEMLPLIDKPIIQHIVEELVGAPGGRPMKKRSSAVSLNDEQTEREGRCVPSTSS